MKAHCRGRAELFRYCDDMVICCQLRTDADRILKALEGRLAKAALSLNLDKTRLVSFDRKAFRRGEQQDSFDFLGFIVPRAKEILCQDNDQLCATMEEMRVWPLEPGLQEQGSNRLKRLSWS